MKSLQTISVRHPTKFELMIYVDAETPIGFTIITSGFEFSVHTPGMETRLRPRLRKFAGIILSTALSYLQDSLLSRRLWPCWRLPIVKLPNQFHQLCQKRRPVVLTMAHNDRAKNFWFVQLHIGDICASEIADR